MDLSNILAVAGKPDLNELISRTKSGAIDKAGNLIIDARFDNMHPFSEGLAYARIGDTHGFINTSGTFEIQKPVTKATLIDKLMKRGNWIRW